MGRKSARAGQRGGRRRGANGRAARVSFAKRLFKAAPVLLAAAVLTFLLGQAGALQHLETVALDTHARLQAPPRRSDGTLEQSDVAIVLITDDLYRSKFGGKSPLNPDALKEVIEAIARGRPRLIGVDIDTSAAEFRKMKIETAGVPVVWGRNALYSQREEKFLALPVLGGQEGSFLSGLMVLREDGDGVARRYQRVFQTTKGPFPSFPWAIVKQLPEHSGKLSETDDEMLIGFIEDKDTALRVNLPASNVLRDSHEQGWLEDSLIKDKVVLLGGDYAVQDEHDTPIGWRLGVEVLAQAIETELRGGGFRPAKRPVIAVLQILDGLVILLLFHFRGVKQAIPLALVAIPVLALIGSLLAFRSLGYWVYFVFVLTAVLVQQIYDKLGDYRKDLAVQGAETITGSPESGRPK